MCSGLDLMRIRYGRCTYRRTIAQTTPARSMSPAASPIAAKPRYTSPCRNFADSGIWWLISETVVTASRIRNEK